MDNNEFEMDFDFEKEFGLDGVQPLDSEYTDLDFSPDFLNGDDTIDFQLDPELDAELTAALTADASAPVESEPDIPAADEDAADMLTAEDIPAPEELPGTPEEPGATAEQEAPAEKPAAPVRRRPRRKKSKEQMFKEVYLPAGIAGAAALLILVFIIGSIGRAVAKNNAEKKAAKDASIASSIALAEEQAEVKSLLAEAADLAAGYNYEAAIAKLDSFSGTQSDYAELVAMKSTYTQLQSQVVAWSDPSKITNLSFQMLIADPGLAFSDQTFGKSYNRNFVTIDEFSAILQQLYEKGYVLVDFDSFVEEIVAADGSVTYSVKTIYLPEDKTPIMLTETMVNYYDYMTACGGFANKLVLKNGEITAQMVTSDGETVYGDYDFVPILNHFLEAHPDFSYQGARAILAVTGEEGVFGYDVATEAAAAKELVAELRAQGYTIACYTYANQSYSVLTATEIKADLDKWAEKITPVLGDVDVIVYAKSTDITDHSSSRFTMVYDAGFRYLVGASNTTHASVSSNYVTQQRLMVTGTQMAHTASLYANFFDAASILNSQRGTVPN